MTASEWLKRIVSGDDAFRVTYGCDAAGLQDSLKLWQDTIHRFLDRFGDREVRLFRSPGRINLRGMHVDTHGGFLNLMTHQRETVIVASLSGASRTTAVNADPAFPDVAFSVKELGDCPEFSARWDSYIMSPRVRARVGRSVGSWGNYVEGCALNVLHRRPEKGVPDLVLAVGSNLPRGAALSSSAALCTGLVLAFGSWADTQLSPEELILAARDAEWYAGSRCGVSDQAAMVLGQPNQCINIALHADRLDLSTGRAYALSDEVCVLVVNSQTERSLSGKQLIDYTRNRFVYSMALNVCRQELAALGIDATRVQAIEDLPALAPSALDARDGLRLLYRLLRSIPETVDLAFLRERYRIPDLDTLYLRHFGSVPEEHRPDRFGMRGPLLFGIAESERARLFPDVAECKDWSRAGALMLAGHNGDRRVDEDGCPYVFDTSDVALDALEATAIPIEDCPGAYGASTPALDFLVDTAIRAGAYGACLTGAGLAGSVIALCPAEKADVIAEKLRARIGSREYAQLAGVPEPFSQAQVEMSVVVNHAIAGAGEMRL